MLTSEPVILGLCTKLVRPVAAQQLLGVWRAPQAQVKVADPILSIEGPSGLPQPIVRPQAALQVTIYSWAFC